MVSMRIGLEQSLHSHLSALIVASMVSRVRLLHSDFRWHEFWHFWQSRRLEP